MIKLVNDSMIQSKKFESYKIINKSLIERPIATSTKTTGYTERAVAIPKYEYSDIWEDGLEELLFDCKDVDDRVEWDIDYHGGMFGDTETLYLYSNADTYEEVKYFIQQWRDKVMYESMKRRKTKTVKEDSFDDVGFDYKIRYISNFQQDALYDLVDYLVSIGAISGPEDKRIDIIEEPQLDSVQIKLLSDFKTYKKALDWIKHNDAYFYESKRTRMPGKKLHEQDVEIEVKHEGILEVPEGKNVEDLPMSHFEKLVKKNGLGKVNKALNNLQVWNKNKNKKLSKWAGDMIDKLNKKFEKSEGVYRKRVTENYNSSYWKYNVIDLDRVLNSEDDIYFTKQSIRRVKLVPCQDPQDCYDGDWYPVCDYEYPYDVFYGTKEEAYDMLLTSINNGTYERINYL